MAVIHIYASFTAEKTLCGEKAPDVLTTLSFDRADCEYCKKEYSKKVKILNEIFSRKY